MGTPRPSACADRLIVALDFTAWAPARRMARRLSGLVRTLKVGSALFTACGPDAVARLRRLGFQVMLDLKFFDIPSTVELSCRTAARQQVDMLTVHAAGGRAMLEAAVRGVRAEARRMAIPRPEVLAVTRLTSSARGATGNVLDLARVAHEAGCDGVVAAVEDAGPIHRRFPRLTIICPGIRPAWAVRADQRRTGTPAEALAAGADRLVVGRPITGARRPRDAAQRILGEMEGFGGC